MSSSRKWQFIWHEDWKVCGVVAIFCVVEIVSIFQIVTRFEDFENGNLLGALAVTLLIVPCLIFVFGYFWFKIARLKQCPNCKEMMIRLPKPKAHGEYKQQCPICKQEVGTGVRNKSGNANSTLGKALLRKSSTSKDDKSN